MSRIRSIKPEWIEDERMSEASDAARVMSVALLLMADDHGNGRAGVNQLAGRVFPGKPREHSASALEELARLQYVILYVVEGQKYYSIRNWGRHQRVDKPSAPKVPLPTDKNATILAVSDTTPESPGIPREVPELPSASRASPSLPFLDQDQPTTLEKGEESAQKSTPGKRPRKPKRAHAVPLPDDWAPKDTHRDKATKHGLDIETEVAKMRNWAKSKDERKVDWDAAFHGWLLRAADDAGRRGPRAPPVQAHKQPSTNYRSERTTRA